VIHYFSDVKNITISLPDELAHRAKVFAAEHNTSVSRFVGDMLAERLREDTRYRRAMKQWALREVGPLSDGETPYPSRDSLHER
jgi:plasmid stability protein